MATPATDKTRSAFITGASTGIGLACVEALHGRGWQVFALVRKQADADALSARFTERVTPLIGDVTDHSSLEAAATKVAETLGNRTLNGIVCNAGIAKAGALLHVPLADYEAMWQVNVMGVIATVRAFAPLLGTDENRAGDKGRIVMMSSVSGVMAKPFFSGYSASKFALEAISNSLRLEMRPYGIGVSIIGPGPIKTPIWAKGLGAIDTSGYADTPYAAPIARFLKLVGKAEADGHEPSVVADAVTKALEADSPFLRKPIVKAWFSNWFLPRLLPMRVVDNLTAKILGLNRS